MVNDVVRNVIRFLLLVFVQGLILKNVEPGPYINPFLYVLFIMQLPFETPPWVVLVASFFTGFCVDLFYGTLGMHMAACTLVGFFRPRLLRFMSPRDGYEFGAQPTIQDMGRAWFITYAVIIIFVHHFVLFYLEIFSLHEFFNTLLRVIVSGAATLVLVVVTQFLFYRSRETT
ncbi:MAG TPA: rod shape-determining protein MreD [Bacteroidia bacterium]|nr:rod shape-determining protein MreD [Bacteroidia bacterium]